MIQLHFHTTEDTEDLVSKRNGEQKIGQTVTSISSLDELKNNPSRYVLFGICEDIGVRANYGKKGTSLAWRAFLSAFLNVQDNRFNDGKDILLLGHISVNPDSEITSSTPVEELGAIVSRIDKMVAQVVKAIVSAGKIPIAVGGGHNNAFGMIKGTADALQQPINAINVDAHTDLRNTEYRHSGNGFRYAYENEPRLLNKYSIFGLHKNYTPEYIFKWMEQRDRDINYTLFEDLRTRSNVQQDFLKNLKLVSQSPFGLEVDCDAISNFNSSAITPSGLNLSDVRNIISTAGLEKNCCYFHLCEAIPNKKNVGQIGKALSYMVTDFIQS